MDQARVNEVAAAAARRIDEALAGRLAGIGVFGSRASGEGRDGSDLDLAVLPRQPLDPVELWRLAQEVAAAVHLDVDLVDLWRASTVLQKEVVEGVRWLVIHDRAAWEAFEATALTRYGHLNEERREILEAFVAEGAGEGPGG